jgi:hypothetical protein
VKLRNTVDTNKPKEYSKKKKKKKKRKERRKKEKPTGGKGNKAVFFNFKRHLYKECHQFLFQILYFLPFFFVFFGGEASLTNNQGKQDHFEIKLPIMPKLTENPGRMGCDLKSLLKNKNIRVREQRNRQFLNCSVGADLCGVFQFGILINPLGDQ